LRARSASGFAKSSTITARPGTSPSTGRCSRASRRSGCPRHTSISRSRRHLTLGWMEGS
jgi:hypothetical protein